MLLGLTGTKASGKGAVAEILKEKGFSYLSLSDAVREEAARRGMKNYNIKDLQDIGNELREKFGIGIWAKKTLEKVEEGKKEKKRNYIIDGIRNLGEIEELRKNKNFILISVSAPLKERFKRLSDRGRESDPKDWESFLEMDKRDKGGEEKDSGQQVDKCMEMADIKIINNSSIENLKNKVEEVCNQKCY